MAIIQFTSGHLDGQDFEIPLGESRLLGRSGNADIICRDSKMSRRHCLLESGMLGFLITDLDSANGTWVNDVRISEAVLEDGDRIRVGESALIFHDDADYAADATHIEITAKRSKMAVARQASKGNQDGYISAKSHFCETCGLHIAEEDRESGASKKIDGVWVCPPCVSEYKEMLALGTVNDIRGYTGFRRKRELVEGAEHAAGMSAEAGEGPPAEETGRQTPIP